MLDDKIAEYVFFPLYNIFRQLDRYPMPLVETCVKCLTILVSHGWRSQVSSKLVQQILSLVTFIIDGVPDARQKREVPEETILECFRALSAIFYAAKTSPTAASGLTDSESMPVLGHGITVILDGVVEGATPPIQQAALLALRAIYSTIKEDEALASFFPGTMSSLTKVLSRPARYKSAILTESLHAVREVSTRVLGDIRTRSIIGHKGVEDDPNRVDDSSHGKVRSPAWLRATTAQTKLALSTIMKLRKQGAPQVRASLNTLCLTLLDECHITLSNCKELLVETAMMLDSAESSSSSTETSLLVLVSIYPELGDAVKRAVYSQTTSLPSIMLSSEENSKRDALHTLANGIRTLRNLRMESLTLEEFLLNNLKDGVVSMVRSTKSDRAGRSSPALLLTEVNSLSASPPNSFPSILFSHESQQRIQGELLALVNTIAATTQSANMASGLLEQAQDSTSENQVAALWLCFQLVKATHDTSANSNALLDLSAFDSSSDETESTLSSLYSFAVQILDSHTDFETVDWRLEAIALEITAYAAERSGESFRPELIDILFPVATLLGSDNRDLQLHSIVALNSLASACQYSSVADLIIENEDYMINSVALRLNTLDISLASTKVLVMMIRLGGPRLIPFLDDVVQSIFMALDNFHGYPAFVEALFAVLKEAVDQGVRSDTLLLEKAKCSKVDHKKCEKPVEGFDTLVQFLKERKKRKDLDKAEEEEIAHHPTHPWNPQSQVAEQGKAAADDTPTSLPSKEEAPKSPTYQLLLRISNLTQHYLTSPTPKLRRSLLELLATATSALAADEESFLPLVSAIWPVVVERLHDAETYIVIEACHTLGGLCEAAGDFLSTRFKTEWWDGLGDWCRKTKREAASRSGRRGMTRASVLSEGRSGGDIMIPRRSGDNVEGIASSLAVPSQHSGSLGQFAPPARLWAAVTQLLTAMVTYVRLEDQMFDEILDLLSDVMENDAKTRAALETINADAVWLVRYEKGLVQKKAAPPETAGLKFVNM